MPRLPRSQRWTEAACYHVFNRGHNRQIVFTDDLDRAEFLARVDRYRRQFGLRLYHYCLMDNHFHLLLQLDDPRRLSRVMAGLFVAYGHHFHRRHGYVGHLWQGRYKSPAIERDSYLLSCGRYIERNPLVADMVGQPWDYRWSSCRASALGEVNPLLTANPCYEELGGTAAERQERWRAFLLAEDPKEKEVRRIEGVVGEARFQQRLEEWQGRAIRGRRGRKSKETDRERPISM
jgi:putative transposase